MIDIQDKSKCCGCYACYSICPTNAIKMERDEKGFEYPVVIKEKCINCGLCEKACPILKNNINDKNNNFPIAYACKNKNEEIRLKSSSGGIFTLIAKSIIDLGGIVFGAGFDEKYNVVHSYITNESEISRFRGSKYVQSTIGNMYKKAKEFLDEGKYVLFTGTPCQIEGLKTYLKKEYDKLYTQDIICHGVPSPKVWNKYINEMNRKYDGNIKEINFRKKDIKGWNLYQLSMKYDNDEYLQIHKNDPYMQAFLRDAILRESCYNCKFKKKNRISDITLADFWGIKNIKPELDDDKGTSLVIINSQKGQELMDKIKKLIEVEKVNFEEAIKYNPSMLNSVQMPSGRDKFFENLDKDIEISELVSQYATLPNRIQRILRKIKKLIVDKKGEKV